MSGDGVGEREEEGDVPGPVRKPQSTKNAMVKKKKRGNQFYIHYSNGDERLVLAGGERQKGSMNGYRLLHR